MSYDPIDEDGDLITPAQIKLIVDTMISTSHFNDEYVACEPDYEKRVPVGRYLIQMEYWIRKARDAIVKNDISSVLEEMMGISQRLNIPIDPASKSALLVGRAMLRAEAQYYEEYSRRERNERGRGIPEYDFSSLTLDELKAKVLDAWERERHPERLLLDSESPVESIEPIRNKAEAAEALILKPRLGRPPDQDWHKVKRYVFKLLDDKGWWGDRQRPEWKSLNSLMKAVFENHKLWRVKEPGVSTLRKHLRPMVAEWRQKNEMRRRKRQQRGRAHSRGAARQ